MMSISFISLLFLSQATLSFGQSTFWSQKQTQQPTIPSQPIQSQSQQSAQVDLSQFQQPQQQIAPQLQFQQSQPTTIAQGQIWSSKPPAQPMQWPTDVNPQQIQPQPDQTQPQPDQIQPQPDQTQPQPDQTGQQPMASGIGAQGQGQEQGQGQGIASEQRGQPFTQQTSASAAAFTMPQIQAQTVDLSSLQPQQYNKFPRQIMPVQYSNPTYTTLPTHVQAAQIPHVKSQTTQTTAQTITKPTQYQTMPTIHAQPLYGKAQNSQQPQQ